MKRTICIIIAAAMIMALFTGCGKEKGIFGEIVPAKNTISLGRHDRLDVMSDVLKAEGLTEADVTITRSEKQTAYVTANEEYYFEELAPYGVKKTFIFKYSNDALHGIQYDADFLNVPFEEAYAASMKAFDKVEKVMKKAETMEYGSIESLQKVGGSYTKQYRIKITSLFWS